VIFCSFMNNLHMCMYIYIYIFRIQKIIIDPMVLYITIGELQHNTTHCNIHLNGRSCFLQHSNSSATQCDAHYNTMQHTYRMNPVLQCVTLCCSVLHCVAVCCSVLQWVAVCCSVIRIFCISLSEISRQ